MDDQKKTAIITGSNRGIGKEFVKSFAHAGYDIYACARKQDESFETFLDDLSADCGVEIKPVYFDLSCEEEIKEGMKSIFADKKKIDVLINNAGVAFGGLFTMTSLDKLKEVYQVNVFAQVQLMQLVSRVMMRQKIGLYYQYVLCRWN